MNRGLLSNTGNISSADVIGSAAEGAVGTDGSARCHGECKVRNTTVNVDVHATEDGPHQNSKLNKGEST